MPARVPHLAGTIAVRLPRGTRLVCPVSSLIPQRNRDGSWANLVFRHSNPGLPPVRAARRSPRARGRGHLAPPAVFFMLRRASGDSRVRWWQPTTRALRSAGPTDRRPRAMQAVTLSPELAPSAGASDRLRHVLLVRIAGGEGRLTRLALAQDLGALAPPRLPPARWRPRLERELDGLLADGWVLETGDHLRLSEVGGDRVRRFLAVKGSLPRAWSELRDGRLVAKALGLERLPNKALKALARPDGLRAAVVQTAYKLKLKGLATPARLRSALARIALQRAFGNGIGAGLAGKGVLSAKAARLLAGQLSTAPRDFGTDRRLIAALAAEHVGAKHADFEALRRALLCRFLESALTPVASPPPSAAAGLPPAGLASPLPPAPPAAGRPDLGGFVGEVRRQAAAQAQGWVGDRKAYISHVWRALAQRRADWRLSEIEFKCMLVEAHRTGQLALMHADLKDHKSIKDVQESAVVYKNAVFHFVRVEG